MPVFERLREEGSQGVATVGGRKARTMWSSHRHEKEEFQRGGSGRLVRPRGHEGSMSTQVPD